MMVSGEKCVRSGWLCVSAGQIPPGSQEVWMPLFNFADEISYDCNEYTSSYGTLLAGLSNTTQPTNQHNNTIWCSWSRNTEIWDVWCVPFQLLIFIIPVCCNDLWFVIDLSPALSLPVSACPQSWPLLTAVLVFTDVGRAWHSMPQIYITQLLVCIGWV